MKLKILLLLSIIALLMVGFLPVIHAQYAQPSQQQTEEILGTIEEINYETSQIVLKSYKGEDNTAYEDVAIYVRQEAIIEKDGTPLELRELNRGDKVVVKYRISDDGGREAVHVWRKWITAVLAVALGVIKVSGENIQYCFANNNQ